MHRISTFIFIYLFSIVQLSYGQWYKPEELPKKTQELFREALNEINYSNYEKAFQLLDECLKKNPRFLDGYYIKAGIYSEQKNYPSSVALYEKAVYEDTVYAQGYMMVYSIALAGNGQFQKALDAINKYLQMPNLNERTQKAALKRKSAYEFALIQQTKKTDRNYTFSPVNMGDKINSRFSEYFPMMTIDRSTLIFTRKGERRDEDFYESRRNGEFWKTAMPLEGNLNTPNNEGAQTISQDGKTLYFTACEMEDGYGSCDLFVSYLINNQWSERINLGTSVNSEHWESQPSLSPDQQVLYFTSSRPNGNGGSDLYYCTLLPTGKWSEPVNMGPDFNTPGEENSPFIHADNQTFYFASSGLPGYGGTDLFVSRKQPDGKWGKPENLGYPINTIDDEGTLFVSADGKTGIFASDGMDSRGGLDLYTFELPSYAQPAKTLWITGKVFDKKTLAQLPSVVELKDIELNQTISIIQTQIDGTYLIPMPVGKNYAFYVNRKGYLFFSETFSMKENQIDSGFVVDIPLTPIEKNASINLKNIFFQTGKSDIQPSSFPELDKLVQLLRENPSLKVEIIGHTDNVGKENDNMTLSNHRAAAVVNYLLNKGIGRQQLSSRGMGDKQAIADNKDESGRAQNRRTELKVLSFQ